VLWIRLKHRQPIRTCHRLVLQQTSRDHHKEYRERPFHVFTPFNVLPDATIFMMLSELIEDM
jgi:hypothetical protein